MLTAAPEIKLTVGLRVQRSSWRWFTRRMHVCDCRICTEALTVLDFTLVVHIVCGIFPIFCGLSDGFRTILGSAAIIVRSSE